MNGPNVGNLSGIARPSFGLRRQFSILRPTSLDLGTVLQDVDAVAALAAMLEQGIAKVRAKDGRVDTRDLAHGVLAAMRPSSVATARVAAIHGRATANLLPAVIDDEKAVHAFACLLTEAIETRQQPGTGKLDMNDVAAHVIAEMRRHPK